MKQLLYLVAVGFVVLSCSREPMNPQTGTFIVQMDHVVGGAELALNGTVYTNAAGEAFTVSQLNYFISNIRLRRPNGTDYVVPQDSSYFLVRESDRASQKIRLNNIPTGRYTGLSFLVGVDSLRSVSGVEKRRGVLDPGTGGHTSGMAWDWNTGYIFLRLEGTSTVVEPDATGGRNYRYHIGLFGRNGTLNNLRTVALSFSGVGVDVQADVAKGVVIKADVQKIFNGKTQLSLAQTPNIMIAPKSSEVADNYATMFSVGGSVIQLLKK